MRDTKGASPEWGLLLVCVWDKIYLFILMTISSSSLSMVIILELAWKSRWVV